MATLNNLLVGEPAKAVDLGTAIGSGELMPDGKGYLLGVTFSGVGDTFLRLYDWDGSASKPASFLVILLKTAIGTVSLNIPPISLRNGLQYEVSGAVADGDATVKGGDTIVNVQYKLDKV